ncbi:hypothetical protein LWI29_004229 [Acer saccharum]|uniref:Uncharacterized protein n=1 Tax=Acer saccharum TaxID=4024 RepID=A0AA39STU4_ACESA|nr:hypothetical protein LWI29_004229 [Acer saccharum]
MNALLSAPTSLLASFSEVHKVFKTMKINIKESSIIYPAQDTPKRKLWLSNLDLLVARIHLPTIYFYKPNGSSNFFNAQLLKETLSKALVPFYPVAGRLGCDENGRLEIQCNAEGVLFVEAETESAVDDFNGFTPCLEFRQLVPEIDYSSHISSYPLLVLQVTYFKCGGVTLGVGMHHSLADGASSLRFIKTWADIACGISSTTITPLHDRKLLLRVRIPPTPALVHHNEYDIISSQQISDIADENHSTVMFNITLEQLKTLKRKSSVEDRKFSTFELLAAHIWQCTCKARGLAEDLATRLYIPVDGRSRLDPPLPDGYFGNVLFSSTSVALSSDLKSEPLSNTAVRIQKALKQMDNEYLRSALDYLQMQTDLTPLIRRPNAFRSPNLNINSWVRLPVHDADFGWGRPVFMGPASVLYEGTVYVLPSPTDDGSLSLIVRLEACHMQLFHKLLYNYLQ